MEIAINQLLSSKRYNKATRRFHGVFKKETELSLGTQ